MNSEILWYILLIAFIIRTLRNAFHQAFLWQLKEYRFDRIFAHLKTGQGKKLFLGPLTLFKWIPLIIYSSLILWSLFYPLPESDYWSNLFAAIYYFFWSVWILEAILNLSESITRGWKLPKFTLKIGFILLPVFILQFGTLRNNIQAPLILGPILDKLLPLSIFVFAALFNIPSWVFKKIIIIMAIRKISSFNNLKVIGITGSYGKTSTKEFLATILSEKFKVAKTYGFNNTDIGIAKCILRDLKPEHQIFVVEMGAYKKGEIKTICDMVKPNMGIITGINEQHLELFGSLENTMKAKFELVESLPKGSIVILNGNNSHCMTMARWAKAKELKIFTFRSDSDIKNIKVSENQIEFTLTDKNTRIKIHLLGRQTIENVLAAIYASNNLGMTFDEIIKGVSRIVPFPNTMQFTGKLGGMTFVDDTFNANPDGVLAAVDYMKIFKGKKILVLTPLIELGEGAEKIHERIGKQGAEVCDMVLLTNYNYYLAFISGAHKVSGETKIQIVNSTLGTNIIRENLDKDGIVVFEGKESGKLLKMFGNYDV